MGIDEKRHRGEELLEKMLGSDQAARIRENWRKISPEFEEYVVEFLSGEIWSREGLDLRTKSLVTIATLAGMGRTLGLELNIRMALRNGATQREVIETLLHIAPYAGFPAAWEGLAMADRVFAEERDVDGSGLSS